MENISFTVLIQATPSKVWKVLWNDYTYRQWTAAFSEGSYAVSDWIVGSKIQFLSPSGNGMYSIIEKRIEDQYMAFQHIGEIKNFEEMPVDESTKAWTGCMETYTLTEKDNQTELEVSVDVIEEHKEYFFKAFPAALERVIDLSEKPVTISIETLIEAPIEKIWNCWTQSEHITNWNHASDDWHCPTAVNDLREGGTFNYTMAAKDGSVSFDFNGTHTKVQQHHFIHSKLGDGRNMSVSFKETTDGIIITEQFEAEEENSYDLQKMGWQMILENFKKHVVECRD